MSYRCAADLIQHRGRQRRWIRGSGRSAILAAAVRTDDNCPCICRINSGTHVDGIGASSHHTPCDEEVVEKTLGAIHIMSCVANSAAVRTTRAYLPKSFPDRAGYRFRASQSSAKSNSLSPSLVTSIVNSLCLLCRAGRYCSYSSSSRWSGGRRIVRPVFREAVISTQ